MKGRRGLSHSKTRSTIAVFARPEREMTRTILSLRCNVTCCESLNETLNARQNFQRVGNDEGVCAGHLTWCLITSPSLTRDCLTRLMGRRWRWLSMKNVQATFIYTTILWSYPQFTLFRDFPFFHVHINPPPELALSPWPWPLGGKSNFSLGQGRSVGLRDGASIPGLSNFGKVQKISILPLWYPVYSSAS